MIRHLIYEVFSATLLCAYYSMH